MDNIEMIPFWLQIIGLMGSFAWPSYQLWLAIFGPRLKVHLTKDLFFRLTDQGECIFLQPILLAEHGNILLLNVEAVLKKLDYESKKEWGLEFLRFGEIVRNQNEILSNFFYQSTGALRFLPKGTPLSSVFLCRPINYGTEYSKLISEFKEKLLKLKLEAENNGEQDKIPSGIKKVVDEFSPKLFEQIQLEKGKYCIELVAKYSATSGLPSIIKYTTKKSVIRFEVNSNARDLIKTNLPDALTSMAFNMILNTNLNILYPEYAPESVATNAQ